MGGRNRVAGMCGCWYAVMVRDDGVRGGFRRYDVVAILFRRVYEEGSAST